MHLEGQPMGMPRNNLAVLLVEGAVFEHFVQHLRKLKSCARFDFLSRRLARLRRLGTRLTYIFWSWSIYWKTHSLVIPDPLRRVEFATASTLEVVCVVTTKRIDGRHDCVSKQGNPDLNFRCVEPNENRNGCSQRVIIILKMDLR